MVWTTDLDCLELWFILVQLDKTILQQNKRVELLGSCLTLMNHFWWWLQGLFVSGVSYWLQLWCIEKKGPVYVAMFSPLSVLITAIIAAVVWAELLYLGRFVCSKILVLELVVHFFFSNFSGLFLDFLLVCHWLIVRFDSVSWEECWSLGVSTVFFGERARKWDM